MRRRTFDVIVSSAGLLLAALLLAAGGMLTWAHGFVRDEVHSQLAAQQIYFPAKDSKAIAAPEYEAMRKYGGQQLTTGAQAKTYADHYIANHLTTITGGKTYAELSSAAQENPDDAALAAKVDTAFKGETLRGLLLNAYAFDTMGTIAGIAAIAAFVAAAVLLLLSALGLWHSRSTSPAAKIFTGHADRGPDPAAV